MGIQRSVYQNKANENKSNENKSNQKKANPQKVADNRIMIRMPLCLRVVFLLLGISGIALVCYCCIDGLRGNETATPGIIAAFTLITGLPGAWLIGYSFQRIVVDKESIAVRNSLLRTRYFQWSDIRQASYQGGCLCVMGEQGKLFKIQEGSRGYVPFLNVLEEQGIKVQLPGQKLGRFMSVSHPDREKRQFSTRLLPVWNKTAYRLSVAGDTLILKRFLGRPLCFLVSEVREVRIRENRDKFLKLKIYRKNGRCLARLRQSAFQLEDKNCVFALLRHLAQANVPVRATRLPQTGETLQCMMRQRFVDRAEAGQVLEEEYERILFVLKKCNEQLQQYGVSLAHGMIDRCGLEQFSHLPGLVVNDTFDSFAGGYYFCLVSGDCVICDRQGEVVLFDMIGILIQSEERAVEETDGEAAAGMLYFRPLPVDFLQSELDILLRMIKRRQFSVSKIRFLNG